MAVSGVELTGELVVVPNAVVHQVAVLRRYPQALPVPLATSPKAPHLGKLISPQKVSFPQNERIIL